MSRSIRIWKQAGFDYVRVRARFYRFVLFTDSCWLWQGFIKENGYGQFGVSKDAGIEYAHRMALMFFLGRPLAPGEQANHRCDTRACVRVSEGHVYLGTQHQNLIDAGKHMSRAWNESNFPSAKLSKDDVIAIRALWSESSAKHGLQTQLARRYGVTPACIHEIVRAKTWRE